MTNAFPLLQLALLGVGIALFVVGLVALRLLRLCLIALTRIGETSRQQSKKVATLVDEVQRLRRGR